MDTAQSTQWIEGLRQGGPLLALIGVQSLLDAVLPEPPEEPQREAGA